jgi:hypothetical protein
MPQLRVETFLTISVRSAPVTVSNTTATPQPSQAVTNNSAASDSTAPLAHCPYPDRSIYSYMGVKQLRFQVRCNTGYPRTSRDVGALVETSNECIDSCGKYNDGLKQSTGFCLGATWSNPFSSTGSEVMCWIMTQIDPAALPNSTENSAILQF